MKRSEINQPPCYFDRYINQLDDIDLNTAFDQSVEELESLDSDRLALIGEAVYAPGKWTIKDTIQHLIDVEHILSYRALRFARNDKTPLPGFDESVFAANVKTENREIKSLIAELIAVRRASALLFASFTDEALLRIGLASEIQMSALAFGFTLLGHQKHHLKILVERYDPLGAKR